MASVYGGWNTTNRFLAKFFCVRLKDSLRKGGSKNANWQMDIAFGARDMLHNPTVKTVPVRGASTTPTPGASITPGGR